MRIYTLLTIFLISGNQLFASDRPSIIPVPSFYEIKQGYFRFNENIRLYADPEFEPELHFFQKELLRFRNMALRTSGNGSEADVLFQYKHLNGQALYHIEVRENLIIVNADSGKGIFYGAVSLLQLINNSDISGSAYMLPSVTIRDSPEYEWRGLMLDESRHFFGKEKVKFILDWMAYYKLNRFHWHLTDEPGWRIEIKKYPKLGLVGGIGNHTNPYAEPRLPLYFDFVQHSDHRFGRRWGGRFNELHDVYGFSVSHLVPEEQRSLILGFQGNVWTETIDSEQRLDFMMFPRIAALAEAVWSKESQKDHPEPVQMSR